MSLSIPKDQFRHPSEDYQFLRKEGLHFVEQLASRSWTDYNTHDPGITLLEALCWSITDLSYRTSFDIKDILAKAPNETHPEQTAIFTAREILTCNPWNRTDWRKLLVDIDGVFNAWLFKAESQEVDFYADRTKNELRYFSPQLIIKAEQLGLNKTGSGNPPGIEVNQSKLEDLLTDPNNLEIDQIKLPLLLTYVDSGQDNTERLAKLYVLLPGWAEIERRVAEFLPFINMEALILVELGKTSFNNVNNTWQADIGIRYLSDATEHQLTLEGVLVAGVNNPDLQAVLEAHLQVLTAVSVFYQYRLHLWNILSRLIAPVVKLRGLYDVLLEFEQDEVYGDLNSAIVNYQLFVSLSDSGLGTQLTEIEIEALMPAWKNIYGDIKTYLNFINAPILDTVTIENDFFSPEEKFYRADLRLKFTVEEAEEESLFRGIEFRNISDQEVLDALRDNLSNQLNGSGILGFFHGKLKRLLKITEAVESALHKHRNLCEDWLSIGSICVNEIAICADIDIASSANLETVQAAIFYALEQYLSPPVKFYALAELLEQKIPTEEIFNGPPLVHGFIKTDEIERTDLEDNRCIYASDMINIIMDIEGVQAVRAFLMTKYDVNGIAVLPSQSWIIKLDYRHKARLSIGKSKLLFFKSGLPYILRDDRLQLMIGQLEHLRAINDRTKLTGAPKDLEIPAGKVTDFRQYTPLRFLLPDTYGVGNAGLSETATIERRAKAKQLQAYLALYDQLLANYLSQLEHVGDLFALDKHTTKELKRTYYTQFLAESSLGEDIYVDAAILEDPEGADHGYRSLQRLSENEAEYLDRRSRFLDHLLARFAEDFSTYTLLLNTYQQERPLDKLIEAKIAFLSEYPVVSSQRGKGFNYRDATAVWDTDNVPGLQKRIGRLLGMSSFERRSLHCLTIRDEIEVVELSPVAFNFRLEQNGASILTSTQTYGSEHEAFSAKERLIELSQKKDNYDLEEDGGLYRFQIGRIIRTPGGAIDTKEVLAESPGFNSAAEAQDKLDDLFQQLTVNLDRVDPDCEKLEGFHMIEHLLLRPKHEFEDNFIAICFEESCGVKDPYSFRVSVILPYWIQPETDRLMKFRNYIDNLFRQEAPAHIYLKICWVGNEHLRRFETYYQRWLSENVKPCPDPEQLTFRLKDMLRILEEMHSLYNEGFLHDCDDSVEENTIILDKSALGSLRPTAPAQEEES